MTPLRFEQDEHKLVIYNLTGKPLVTVHANTVDQAMLAGPDLVVRDEDTVRVYDAASGKLRSTRPLTSPALTSTHLADVDSGIALYEAGNAVRLLRLSDGRDRVFRKVKGLVSAELEPSGLFYAYNVPNGSAKPGRVAFVPFAKVTAALG